MKKSQSIQYAVNDFTDIYDTILSVSVYQYVSSSFFKGSNQKLNIEEEKIYDYLKKIERQNNLYNYLTINIISIMESYLHNVLIEFIEKDDSRTLKFVNEYRFEKNITNKNVIEGPKVLTLDTLIINHISQLT
jgi:cyclopropane fatty-acyl-phospholipid synthase-like methyltransferase